MAEKQLRTRIALLRNTEDFFNAANPSLMKGEVCLVDTPAGLKVKVGIEENKTFKELEYFNDWLVRGYLLNGKFYTDSTYTEEIVPSADRLYLDNNSLNKLYDWDIENEKYVAIEPEVATADSFGLVKLYNGSGQNIDGTMTQKAITDGINDIKFNIDSDDSECLILDLPWD